MRINSYSNFYSSYHPVKTFTGSKNSVAKSTLPKSTSVDTLELSNSGKKKNGLSSDVINTIREFAKRDAKIGDYMSDEYNNFQRTYVKNNISPDRSALMAKASPLVPSSKDGIRSFFKYYGLPDVSLIDILLGSERYTASRKMNYVSVKDKNGVEVLSWSQNAGWLSHPSPEEEAFWDAETAIYAEAFSEARAEMRANGEI
ncbi:MAG: hypothetical protein Q4A78_05635 [Peptostreptococcaceae bacterium]|nr:hypothetical protein [Peptostreptococcaceae bacterium]